MDFLKLFVVSLFFSTLSSPLFSFDERELIGGKPVAIGELPEVVYIQSGDARCSATIIGSRVIMTAAHCVADQGSIGPVAKKVIFRVAETEYSAKCEQAPMYRDKLEDHDMALCLVDKELDVAPASISKVGPKIGQKITLTGFGCLDSDANGGNDGILRTGVAKVIQLPAGKDHWFYTRDSVCLCFGDSGGPAMIEPHKLIGVNSRGDIKALSLLTALWTPESIKFFEDFAAEKSVEICGITEDC